MVKEKEDETLKKIKDRFWIWVKRLNILSFKEKLDRWVKRIEILALCIFGGFLVLFIPSVKDIFKIVVSIIIGICLLFIIPSIKKIIEILYYNSEWILIYRIYFHIVSDRDIIDNLLLSNNHSIKKSEDAVKILITKNFSHLLIGNDMSSNITNYALIINKIIKSRMNDEDAKEEIKRKIKKNRKKT